MNKKPERVGLVTAGTKGGVGKTLFLRQLADYLAGVGYHEVSLVDADIETRSLAATGAKLVDLSSLSEVSAMFEGIAFSDSPVTLIDLPAASAGQTLPHLCDFLEGSGEELEEIGLQIFLLFPVTGEPETLVAAADWVKKLKDKVRYGLICNAVRGPVDPVLSTELAKQLLALVDPFRIDMGALEPRIGEELRKQGVQISEVLTPGSAFPFLSDLLVRGKIRRWRQQLFAEFAREIDPLLPALTKNGGVKN